MRVLSLESLTPRFSHPVRADLGATVEEIMQVLKVCVAAGTQSSNLAIPILADELAIAGK